MKKIVITKHAHERISERLSPKGTLSNALYDRDTVIKTLRSVGEDHYTWLTRGKGRRLAAIFNKINDKDRPVAIFEGEDTTVYLKTVYICKEPYQMTKESTCADLVNLIGKDLTF